jgi:aspartate/methionine/tyrosine aminotransferase
MPNFNTAITEQPAYQITALQDKAQALRDQGMSIINATIGDPKDDTPSDVQQTLIHALSSASYSQYPPYIGSQALRTSIVNWAFRAHKIQLDPNHQIIACNGTKEAIYSFPMLFDWSKGQTILMPSLSYPVYQMSANAMQIPTVSLPLTESSGFLPNLDAIDPSILKNTQLFWINSPHNPTTAIASKPYLEQLIRLAETYDFMVCSDECYNDLYASNPPASILEIDSEHWVCFRSLSKRSHMTGYRSGAILSKNNALMGALKKLRSPMGVGTPSFIQAAATWAWGDESHVLTHRNLYNQKRARIKEALIKAGFQVFGGDAGFYMWVKSSSHLTSESLSQWFLDRGILVTPGTVFGPDGDPYIRMVFCLTDDVLDDCCLKITQ